MVNRQSAILLLVGALIAAVGFLAAAYAPFPARLEAGGAQGLALRALLVMSAACIVVSQVYVTVSALRVPATEVRTNKTMELLWSLLPGAFVIGAVLYTL